MILPGKGRRTSNLFEGKVMLSRESLHSAKLRQIEIHSGRVKIQEV